MIIVYKLPGVIIATDFPSIKAKSQSRYNPLGKQTLGLAETRHRFQGAPRSVVGSFESKGRLKTGGICAERGGRSCGLPTAQRTTRRSLLSLGENRCYCGTISLCRLFFVSHSVAKPLGNNSPRITQWKWDFQRDFSRTASESGLLGVTYKDHQEVMTRRTFRLDLSA